MRPLIFTSLDDSRLNSADSAIVCSARRVDEAAGLMLLAAHSDQERITVRAAHEAVQQALSDLADLNLLLAQSQMAPPAPAGIPAEKEEPASKI